VTAGHYDDQHGSRAAVLAHAGDEEMRVWTLGLLSGPADFDVLAAVLAGPRVRYTALEAVANQPDADRVDAVIRSWLNDPDPAVRSKAAGVVPQRSRWQTRSAVGSRPVRAVRPMAHARWSPYRDGRNVRRHAGAGTAGMASMRFVLNSVAYQLDADAATSRLRDVVPEAVREHGVRIGGVVYPVKQAFERASGISRTEFTSHIALRHLRSLGFEILSGTARPSVHYPVVQPPPTGAGHAWPWEGTVQAVFAEVLIRHGWSITAMADTAAKSPGVDVLARKDSRHLGAEVKGWPSDGYADPRRAAETKRTQPSTQAGHWFSQALLKAMLLLDSHSGHDSLMVLPNYPRYRDLATRTRTGRHAARIHVVLLDPDGTFTSEWWTP